MASSPENYFTSLVSSIKTLKKEENIVVDQIFRLKLRENLLVRISEAQVPEKTSFFDLLLKWKYQFAAIPTLLLVFVSVYALTKLPIDFKKQNVTPVVVESQNQIAFENTVSKEPSIQTFPGYHVLPSKFLNNEEIGQNNQINSPNFSASKDIKNYDLNVAQSNILHEREKDETILPKSSSPAESLNTEDVISATDGSNMSTAAQSPIAPPVEVFLSPPLSQSDSTSPTTVAPIPNNDLDQTATARTASPQAENNSAVIAPETTHQNQAVVPENVQSDSYHKIFPTHLNISESTLNDLKKVYFPATFTSEERAFFEKEVATHFIQGKTFIHAYVRFISSTKINVEVFFSDNTMRIFVYELDPVSKKWTFQTGSGEEDIKVIR